MNQLIVMMRVDRNFFDLCMAFCHSVYQPVVIVIIKIIDLLCQQHFFFLGHVDFDIFFTMRDNDAEPRVCKPVKPFEGVKLTTRNQSV